MTIEWFGLPNSAPFWHWPTLFHFAFVALAGGSAFVTAIAALNDHPRRRLYALLTVVAIVLDLATLWAESPARWRFSHVWLFLSFTPSSPIWLGAWSLSASLIASFLVWTGKGPRRVWGALLLLGGTVALLYPGLALAVNVNRPIWTPILLLLFPLTGLLTVIAIAALFAEPWANAFLAPLGVASALLGAAWLGGLAMGSSETSAGFDYLWRHGGPSILTGLVLLAAPAFLRRVPLVAALVPLVGATIVRSLIVEVGQHQFFGF